MTGDNAIRNDPADPPLDAATLALVVLAAAIAQGESSEIRDRVDEAVAAGVSAAWGDELLLQSVLMVGWPRALLAAALWRKATGAAATGGDTDLDYSAHAEWTRRGEETCRRIYGDNYSRLRDNVRSLHPALDAWMVTEGYGRTLSRPGLDLVRRELCTIAQTAVLNTPRQLHSHLRGALLAGADVGAIDAALTAVNPFVSYDDWKSVKELWEQVQDGWSRLA
jgi:4-carboxymuconolactone decarboxylase